MRINMADGSVRKFEGYPVDNSHCDGDAMALRDDNSCLYVGYFHAKCLIAYNLTTMNCIWKKDMKNSVNSVSYRSGLVFVGVCQSEFCVLNANNGDVLRMLAIEPSWVLGHTIVSGMCVCVCLCVYVYVCVFVCVFVCLWGCVGVCVT
jgi:outer membrane protein assembly factor BamB